MSVLAVMVPNWFLILLGLLSFSTLVIMVWSLWLSPEVRCERKGHDWRYHHRVGLIKSNRRTAVVEEVDQKRIECHRCGCLPASLPVVGVGAEEESTDPREWEEHEWLGSVQSYSAPSSYWNVLRRGGMIVETEYWSHLPLLQEIAGPEWDEIRQKTLRGE